MKIMKRLVLAASASLLMAFPSISSAQQFKMASVDMSKIFSEYYKTKKAESELKDRAAGYEKELRDRGTELQKIQEEGKKLEEDVENPAFNEEKKAEKKKVLEAKKTEFRLLGQQVAEMKANRERELRDQQGRVRATLVDEINKVVAEKAKKEGFVLVVDRSGQSLSGVSPFVFVNDSMDITPDIIKTLNASAPAGSATSTPSEKKSDKK